MSKNHMAEVAALLGMELGRPFKISDDTYGIRQSYYRLTEENGCEISGDNTNWVTVSAEVLKWLIMGDVRISKLPWKPAIGTEYYVPSITLAKKYDIRKWYSIEDNERHYNLGIVCKTRYEAIKLANKMLAVVKEGKNNG